MPKSSHHGHSAGRKKIKKIKQIPEVDELVIQAEKLRRCARDALVEWKGALAGERD